MKVQGTILITGAGGIAAETARMAAARGHSIFVASLGEDECRKLSAEITSNGGACVYLVADLTLPHGPLSAVTACLQHYGRIDALFNAVGISGRRFGDGPVHECSDDGWETTFETNVTTAFRMCRETVRRMLRQSTDADGLRGTILNMASVLAFSPEPRHFASHAYAAGKGAIVSLTLSMAAYYAVHGIRVNAIAPGLVRTSMSRRAQDDPSVLEFMKAKQPLIGDLLEPEDVAGAALYLLASDSRRLTGVVLNVDGGWSVA